jgi:hypothetical protein
MISFSMLHLIDSDVTPMPAGAGSFFRTIGEAGFQVNYPAVLDPPGGH